MRSQTLSDFLRPSLVKSAILREQPFLIKSDWILIIEKKYHICLYRFLFFFFELTFSIFSLFCSNFHFLSFALHCLDKIFCKSGLHHVSLRISLIKSGSSQNKRKTYFCANCKFSSWNFKAFCKNKKCEHQHIFAPKAWSDQKCTRTKATIECSPGFHALGKRSFEVYHF